MPEDGARPVPEGQLPMPGGGLAPNPPATTTLGPLAAEIAQKEIELQTAVQQLAAIEPQLTPADTAAELAEQDWLAKSAALAEAEQTLDQLVSESYRGIAALPPDLFIPELPGLQAHAPAMPVEVPIGAEAAARGYIKARDEAQAAAAQLELARTNAETLADQAADLEARIERLTDELERLRDRNAELLVEQERAREQRAQQNADVNPAPVDGYRPHPRAVQAVRFALSQLGKPYVWGAEGPNAYDCSGLVWASYRTVGRTLPRVAADQYWGTRDKLVTRSAAQARRGLLAGDLIFFASGHSWQSIHHVGMYIGNGQMVHAPNSREVVKISPVWWDRLFAVTRVFDAIPLPGTDPGAGNPGSPGQPNPQPGTPPTPPGTRPTTPPPGSGTPTTPPPGSGTPTTPPPNTTTPPTTEPPPVLTTVPQVSAGMSVADVQAALEEAGLQWEVGDPITDGSCPDGAIVLSPPPGTEVERETTVTIQVCEATTPDTPDPEEPEPEESPSETPASPTSSSTPTAIPA
ncbi:MAG TPA: NlpC/P60 family protein [Natronosporangium sp.]